MAGDILGQYSTKSRAIATRMEVVVRTPDSGVNVCIPASQVSFQGYQQLIE